MQRQIGEVTYSAGAGKTWGKVKLKSEGDVDVFKAKFFAGFGFTMGPVHIEIPYAQYFDESYAASIGIIGGVAF